MQLAIKWEIREVSTYLENWMIAIILIALVLLAVVKINNRNVFSSTISSIFLTKNIYKSSSEKLAWTDAEKTILLSIYFLSISLIFTLILKNYFPVFAAQTSSLAFFEIILIIAIATFFIRIGTLSLIQLVVGRLPIISEYSFNIAQSNRFLGLILLPLSLLAIIFTKSEAGGVLAIGLFALAAIYLLRIIRIVINSLKIEGGIFYIILYLCTFEFLPFLVTFHFVNLILKG